MKQNRIIIIYVWFLLMAFVGTGCSSSEPVAEETLSEQPAIFPDSLDVTIPANIAPLRFLSGNGSGRSGGNRVLRTGKAGGRFQ